MTVKKIRPGTVVFSVMAIIIAQLLSLTELVLMKLGLEKIDISVFENEKNFILFGIITSSFFFLLSIFIFFRHNWAKIIYIILASILLLLGVPGIIMTFKETSIFETLMSSAELVLYTAAFAALIGKKQAEWFSNAKEETADTPPWFR